MNLLEWTAKDLVLRAAGIPIPRGVHCRTLDEVKAAFEEIGPCVIKAQVPSGKRGKAGGIRAANFPEEAMEAARAILALNIQGHAVKSVLVEEKAEIAREFYASVLPNSAERAPMVMFSSEGGMDIEEIAENNPDAIKRHIVDPLAGFDESAAFAFLRESISRRRACRD
jgi:succinyl-CoA synthetase beta subunit